jgi:hypothetical protein
MNSPAPARVTDEAINDHPCRKKWTLLALPALLGPAGASPSAQAAAVITSDPMTLIKMMYRQAPMLGGGHHRVTHVCPKVHRTSGVPASLREAVRAPR